MKFKLIGVAAMPPIVADVDLFDRIACAPRSPVSEYYIDDGAQILTAVADSIGSNAGGMFERLKEAFAIRDDTTLVYVNVTSKRTADIAEQYGTLVGVYDSKNPAHHGWVRAALVADYYMDMHAPNLVKLCGCIKAAPELTRAGVVEALQLMAGIKAA